LPYSLRPFSSLAVIEHGHVGTLRRVESVREAGKCLASESWPKASSDRAVYRSAIKAAVGVLGGTFDTEAAQAAGISVREVPPRG
jgi:hypothetical protein